MGIRTKIANWILKDYQPGTRLVATYGKASAGINVSEDSAMRLAAVNACVRVLSEDVASLPEHIYRRTGEGGKERAREHPLYQILHDQPNPEMTAFTFKQTLMVNVLLTGNAYAFLEFDRAGRVIAQWPLPSDMVEPFRKEDTGEMRYRVRGWRDVSAGEMLHVPGLSYDGLKGLSPIAYAREAIGLSKAAEEFGGRFFANGTHIGGIIETETGLSDEAFQRLQDEFSTMYRGLQNAHGIPILEGGAKFKALGVSQQDAQFLDTRKYQRSEIAAIFRVPPHMIGDLERATFSNIEHQSIEYLQRSLVPWLVRIEQEQRRKLLSREERGKYVIEHDTSNFLRGDTRSRMQAYQAAVQGGIMTQNECRARENLNPKEGGDELLRPLNMAKAGEQEPEQDEKPQNRAWDFWAGSERCAVGKDEIAAEFGIERKEIDALISATRAWNAKQADDIRRILQRAEEGRGAFLPKEQRRKHSAKSLIDSLNSYYRYGAEKGAKALEDAVAAGKFPDWQDMTDALNGMAGKAWSDIKGEIGDEAAGIDEEWMRGFMKRYHSDMGVRLAEANLNELKKSIEGANEDKLISILDGILGKWHQGDKAAGMAQNEVFFCVNEAKIAAYRKAGYASIWASGAKCCPICTCLNGRAVKTIKPPLHKGCGCTVRMGGKINGLTPWDDPDILESEEKMREWIASPACQWRIKRQLQDRHNRETQGYVRYVEQLQKDNRGYKPSYLDKSLTKDNYRELQTIVNTYAGTGEIEKRITGDGVQIVEYITTDRSIGTAILPASGKEERTQTIQIRYSKDGVHVVPVKKRGD